jgi:hypothetical protein
MGKKTIFSTRQHKYASTPRANAAHARALKAHHLGNAHKLENLARSAVAAANLETRRAANLTPFSAVNTGVVRVPKIRHATVKKNNSILRMVTGRVGKAMGGIQRFLRISGPRSEAMRKKRASSQTSSYAKGNRGTNVRQGAAALMRMSMN